MPEMPEVEITRKDLEGHIRGTKLSKITLGKVGLRYPFPDRFASSLDGSTVDEVGRRGKFLLLELDNNKVWVTHLGMTGHFRIIAEKDNEAAVASDTAEDKYLRFACTVEADKGAYRLEYRDQRRFGYMLLVDKNKLPDADWYSELGVEPMSEAFTGDYLLQRARGRKVDLKTLLTDQAVVAGIGNAYVCEALWAAKIKPDRPAKTLKEEDASHVVEAVKDVLSGAIEAGEALLGTEKATAGRDGYFDYCYKVYGQEGAPCPRSDGGRIERATSKGRSTFLCPVCQR